MTFPKGTLWVAALVGGVVLSGCSSDGSSDVQRTEQETAKAYISALNDQNVTSLVGLAPSGHEGTEQEARDIIAEHGGRGLKIKSMDVSHDVGPDEASTQVSGTDRQGKKFSTYIQMSREKDTWVVVLGQASGFDQSGKSPASTDPAAG